MRVCLGACAIARLNTERKKQRLPTISRPANGGCHSYGTYWLPILKSAAALALEMNNSAQEIFEAFHELAPPADVAASWNIRPSAKITSMPTEAIA